MLETLANGAVVFDRFDCEVEGKPAETLFCFVPGNAMTPFVVWHRMKNSQSLFWGKFYPGNEADNAVNCFKEYRAAARNGKHRDTNIARELARDLQVVTPSAPAVASGGSK